MIRNLQSALFLRQAKITYRFAGVSFVIVGAQNLLLLEVYFLQQLNLNDRLPSIDWDQKHVHTQGIVRHLVTSIYTEPRRRRSIFLWWHPNVNKCRAFFIRFLYARDLRLPHRTLTHTHTHTHAAHSRTHIHAGAGAAVIVSLLCTSKFRKKLN